VGTPALAYWQALPTVSDARFDREVSSTPRGLSRSHGAGAPSLNCSPVAGWCRPSEIGDGVTGAGTLSEQLDYMKLRRDAAATGTIRPGFHRLRAQTSVSKI